MSGLGGHPLRVAGPAEARVAGEKRDRLVTILRSMGRALIAYSGGVDSSYLLFEAHRALGADALGVIARSPSLASYELAAALELARGQGIPVRVFETHEMDRDSYRANGPDRCFHCKTELFERLESLAREEGWATIAYGAVTDDLSDVRPGMDAARSMAIRAPLIEAGLGKLEVRLLARSAGLTVWDKPQSACLASRIPHGAEVTRAKLSQVESGEAWLRTRFGLRVVRLRHQGDLARIEVGVENIERLTQPEIIERILLQMNMLGFKTVEIDPAGYRRSDPIPDVVGKEVSRGSSG